MAMGAPTQPGPTISSVAETSAPPLNFPSKAAGENPNLTGTLPLGDLLVFFLSGAGAGGGVWERGAAEEEEGCGEEVSATHRLLEFVKKNKLTCLWNS